MQVPTMMDCRQFIRFQLLFWVQAPYSVFAPPQKAYSAKVASTYLQQLVPASRSNALWESSEIWTLGGLSSYLWMKTPRKPLLVVSMHQLLRGRPREIPARNSWHLAAPGKQAKKSTFHVKLLTSFTSTRVRGESRFVICCRSAIVSKIPV